MELFSSKFLVSCYLLEDEKRKTEKIAKNSAKFHVKANVKGIVTKHRKEKQKENSLFVCATV